MYHMDFGVFLHELIVAEHTKIAHIVTVNLVNSSWFNTSIMENNQARAMGSDVAIMSSSRSRSTRDQAQRAMLHSRRLCLHES